VSGYAKQMKYGIEATSPLVVEMSFKHKVLREFCDSERDIKNEEIIFVYANKVKGWVICFKPFGVSMNKLCLTENWRRRV
jgi:hypothetical protein